jgi:hypothetical protein
MSDWAAEEDATLMDLVTEWGKDGVPAAALVPGRTNEQCRERWRTLASARRWVNDHRTLGKWTAEEDAKLI